MKKCESCKKKKLFVRIRVYKNVPHMGDVKSKGALCRKCFLTIKRNIIMKIK